MAARAEAQLAKVLQVVDAAVVLLAIHCDDSCELDDLLESGFNLCLSGVDPAGAAGAETSQVKRLPHPGGGAVGLEGHWSQKKQNSLGWRCTHERP